MNVFLVIAACMAAIAAAAVATPLLRDPRSRVLGLMSALLVIGAAAGLYRLWSTWDWNEPAQRAGAPDVLAMVSKLEARLREQPNDAPGWLMLGRSYLALGRVDDAAVAYDRGRRLDPQSAEAVLGLGEAMSLKAGGEITAPAAELFEQGLKLEPDNPKALLFGGFAAAWRGDKALARSRWEALKGLHPPAQIVQLLDARIAELDAPTVGGPSSAAGGTAPVAGGAAPVAAPGGGAAAGDAQATVNLSIAPALKGRLRTDAPLFLFAREPGGRGPPLAAKRLTSAALGTQVHLSAADSMVPGRELTAGQRVSITARVSFSGQPTPAPGDLYGELSYEVGRDGARDLVIDRVAE